MANIGPFTVVFLYDKQANSLQISPSLKEKGMNVYVVNGASELIQIIAGQKIDLVALSVNHSSTASLVQVLKIKTKVEVLVFGEDATSETSRAILKAGADYQVTGAVSSYNLWLKIGHLVKNKQTQNEAATKMLSGRLRQDDETSAMIIKNSSRSNLREAGDKKVSIVKSNQKANKGIDNEKNDVLSEEPTPKKQALKKDKKPLMGQKNKLNKIVQIAESGPNINKPEMEESPQGEAQADVAVVVMEEKPSSKGKLMKMGKPANKKSLGRAIAKKEKKSVEIGTTKLSEDQLIDREIDKLQTLFFDDTQKIDALDGDVQIFDRDIEDPGRVIHVETSERSAGLNLKDERGSVEKQITQEESSYETEADKIVSIEAARAHRKKQRDKRRKEQKQNNKEEAKPSTVESIDKLRFKKQFREAVSKAGEKGFQKLENKTTIGTVTKVSLIPVDNQSEKGFIVLANNRNDYSTAEEVSEFKNTLINEIQTLEGQQFILGDVYNIETIEVDVAAWAEKNSQFYYQYVEQETGKQVLIGFLRKENLFPNIQKEEGHEMHRIGIGELPPRVPVSFDAYLFLARNDKMLPYLRRGGSLTGKQVQRLYRRGFKFLYIRNEEIHHYYSFYLSLYLNQDFRSERKLA